ncbi:hypothetical protein BU23DRAFT_534905 [Bimuria novae-zelandiae CBS 107.79]|uniref:N-acetyltransferase domain-containing protein n=1 Tax=Bimuria novae-zelandiae CBS 107.79 TaxID=1447943 RepID=A0A6A5VH08_9PLEO|nr:hypothetical protein BU23DRAFT_534905 [Bimuria novae-zelandiae CBS 107.79]
MSDHHVEYSCHAYRVRPDEIMQEGFIRDAAKLFSSEYGVWGRHAAQKVGPSFHHDRRVRMNHDRLRKECVPDGCENIYVIAFGHEQDHLAGFAFKTRLAGHAFATCWKSGGKTVCWVTQLCVKKAHRKRGLATEILRRVKDKVGGADFFGILGSHPAAIMGACRAFGDGINSLHQDISRDDAETIMRSSPVSYVRNAQLKGWLFSEDGDDRTSDHSGCCAFTNFWVDHTEPERVLENLRGSPSAVSQVLVKWPLGELPDGCEFLVLIKNKDASSPPQHAKSANKLLLRPCVGTYESLVGRE